MRKEKITALIVTRNRKYTVVECINSLLKQTYALDDIIVVDNSSSDGTVNCLKENYHNYSNIKILELKENIGSAGGFYLGIKEALKEGFEWVWLMDDDALASPDALEKLSKYFYLKKENVYGLASLIVDKNNKPLPNRGILDLNNFWPIPFKPLKKEHYQGNKFVEIDFAAFIGLLLSREIIEKAGLPNRKMFLYGDDVEWMIRLKKYGKIFLIPDSKVMHNDPNPEPEFKKVLWKKYRLIPLDNFYRYYFAYRNLIYIGRLYCTNRFKFFVGLLTQIIKLFIGIILFDDHKIRRMEILIKGVCHGFKINLKDFQNFS